MSISIKVSGLKLDVLHFRPLLSQHSAPYTGRARERAYCLKSEGTNSIVWHADAMRWCANLEPSQAAVAPPRGSAPLRPASPRQPRAPYRRCGRGVGARLSHGATKGSLRAKGASLEVFRRFSEGSHSRETDLFVHHLSIM